MEFKKIGYSYVTKTYTPNGSTIDVTLDKNIGTVLKGEQSGQPVSNITFTGAKSFTAVLNNSTSPVTFDILVIQGISMNARDRYIETIADTITIQQPENISPDDGSDIFNIFTLESSSFEISGGYIDSHIFSSWQIAEDENFNNVVLQSLEDRDNLTSITLEASAALNTSTTYYWRCKHYGANYGQSPWSEPTTIITPSTFDIDVGTEIGCGIYAGVINGYNLIVSKYDGEKSFSKEFTLTDSETELLSGLVDIGDLRYRTDEEKYYINSTGTNTSTDDWVEIKPQAEPNDEMFVHSETSMLSLNIIKGNIAIRTDENKCYVNITGTNDEMADWQEIDTSVHIWWLSKKYTLSLDHNGCDDWYVPTSSELNMIYQVKDIIDASDDTGNFYDWYYWSSTSDLINNKETVWTQDFDTGNVNAFDRDSKWFHVRPVRRM